MIMKHLEEVPATPVTTAGFTGMAARFALTRDDGCPNFAIRVMEFEPGGSTPLHAHAEEHELFFFEGEPAMRDAGGNEVRLEVGDLVYVAPNEFHQIINAGKRRMRAICAIPILPGGDGKRTTAFRNR